MTEQKPTFAALTDITFLKLTSQKYDLTSMPNDG